MNSMREAIIRGALSGPSVTAESGEQCFCFDHSFIGFDGHFPGYPILPAILQTLMAQILAEEVVGAPLQLVALKRAKFTRQLRPGEKIKVRLSCRKEGMELHCPVQLLVADETASSFTLVFGEAE